MLNLSVFEG